MSVMDTKSYKYSDVAHLHATHFVRNSKAIGVLWGIFTICFAIISIVVFVQPQWLGDTTSSRGTGHFGLWKFCHLIQDHSEMLCFGSLNDFSSMPSAAFRAATVFVGLSVIFVLLSICCLLLFFFMQASAVFHACGWIQLLSAICMTIGLLSFPAGWDAAEVREVCGPNARNYYPGDCAVRWSYVLAIIGCFDIAILSALAFVLGSHYVTLSTTEKGYPTESIYKGEVNTGYVPDNHSTTSRKAMHLQPVLMVSQPGDHDHFSEYSTRTGRSKSSAYAAEYASSMQNFQL